MQFRGDLLGQPYLTLFETGHLWPATPCVTFRLLTYNISRAAPAASTRSRAVIDACRPDVVAAAGGDAAGGRRGRSPSETGMTDGGIVRRGSRWRYLSRGPVEHARGIGRGSRGMRSSRWCRRGAACASSAST